MAESLNLQRNEIYGYIAILANHYIDQWIKDNSLGSIDDVCELFKLAINAHGCILFTNKINSDIFFKRSVELGEKLVKNGHSGRDELFNYLYSLVSGMKKKDCLRQRSAYKENMLNLLYQLALSVHQEVKQQGSQYLALALFYADQMISKPHAYDSYCKELSQCRESIDLNFFQENYSAHKDAIFKFMAEVPTINIINDVVGAIVAEVATHSVV